MLETKCSNKFVLNLPFLDSECGEESFKGSARFHRGPAAAADTQLEGFVAVTQTPPVCDSADGYMDVYISVCL